MNAFLLELQREKRTGIFQLLLFMGILGAAYAFINYAVRADTLLSLPLDPMDVLLTQLYGMMAVLNLFGLVTSSCMIYALEFRGGAIRKLYQLPMSVYALYLSKFAVLVLALFFSIVAGHVALALIGATRLPPGAFEWDTLVRFALYAFTTALPVLSFMLLISSRFENMWIPLGAGVAGFLSGLALAPSGASISLFHPFVVMLRPAIALSARPEASVTAHALLQTLLFLCTGLVLTRKSPLA